MYMEDFTPIENSDNIPNEINFDDSSIKSSTFDEIADAFEYEKTSPKIEAEIESYTKASSSEKEKIDSIKNEGIGNSLDSFGEEETKETEGAEEIEEVHQEIEDYFSSAEFIIFIVDIVMVWGLNYYLKSQELDKISSKEFEKTAREQKILVKAFAKVLMKHSVKISPEVELLMTIGGTYATKCKSIVDKQKIRQQAKIQSINKKNKKKKVVIDKDSKPDLKTRVNVSSDIDDVEIVDEKKLNKDNFKIDTSKEIEEENEVVQIVK